MVAEMGPRLWRASIGLATLLITLWFLPAFTRQWDDRQKARELKAALTAEVATATATMLGPTLDPNLQEARQPVIGGSRQWLVHRLIIEAKLRAYFDETYLAQWKSYSDLAGVFMSDAGVITNVRSPHDRPAKDLSVAKRRRQRNAQLLPAACSPRSRS